MAWVELVPLGLILLLVAWIFLRPYPGEKDEKSTKHTPDSNATAKRDDDKDG